MNAQDRELMARPMQVSCTLPAGALFALIEPGHFAADLKSAAHYRLLIDGKVTELGKLVLGSVDQTALRHKLINLTKARANR